MDGLQFEERGGLGSFADHVLDLFVLLHQLEGNALVFSVLFGFVDLPDALQSLGTGSWSLPLLGGGRGLLFFHSMLELSPHSSSATLLVQLNISQIVSISFSFDVLEQTRLQKHISLQGI